MPNAGGMCSQRLLFPNGSLLGLQHGFPSPVDIPFLTFFITFHFLLLPTCECAGELTPLGRLKLKCDKKIPCGSCVRRGCTSICPNGACRFLVCRCGAVLFVLCYHRTRLTRRHRIVHLGANNFFHRKPLCRPRHKVRACFPPCARAQTSPRSPDALEGGGGRGRGCKSTRSSGR